jgi:hypothetical protein
MKGISLPAVLQVIDLERRSCTVQATADHRAGSLHFRDGLLVHAEAGDLVGEEAVYEILAWQDPEYHVDTALFTGEATLESNIQQLLLESARRHDEAQRSTQDQSVTGVSPGGNGSDPTSASKVPEDGGALDASAGARRVQPPTPDPPARAALAQQASGTRPAVQPVGRGVNTTRLQQAIDAAHAALGDALLAADVCLAADGTSIAGYRSMPAVCALFSQVAAQMSRSLPRSGLPGLGRYLLADLADSQTVLLVPAGAYNLCCVVDSSQIQLGMLLNIVLPELLAAFDSA